MRLTMSYFLKVFNQWTCFYFCEVRATVGLTHWNAKGGSIQARPGKATMRITSWLFAFVSIQSVYKVEITLAGSIAGPFPYIVSRYYREGDSTLTWATNPTCAQVVCETTNWLTTATGTTMANDSIQVSGWSWMSCIMLASSNLTVLTCNLMYWERFWVVLWLFFFMSNTHPMHRLN